MFKHLRIAAASLGFVAASAMPALSQGTLRIGMTAADIPQTTGQPDQGFEGYRFAGYTIYDGAGELGPLQGRHQSPTSSLASPPNGRPSKAIPSAGSSSCARA